MEECQGLRCGDRGGPGEQGWRGLETQSGQLGEDDRPLRIRIATGQIRAAQA